jgi:hypothetical protein
MLGLVFLYVSCSSEKELTYINMADIQEYQCEKDTIYPLKILCAMVERR